MVTTEHKPINYNKSKFQIIPQCINLELNKILLSYFSTKHLYIFAMNF